MKSYEVKKAHIGKKNGFDLNLDIYIKVKKRCIKCMMTKNLKIIQINHIHTLCAGKPESNDRGNNILICKAL